MEVSISILRSAKRRRSTTMRIVDAGMVELRAPERTGLQTLIDFITQNGSFLTKALTIPKQVTLPQVLKSGDSFYVFGQKYRLELFSSSSSSLVLDEETSIITIKKRGPKLSKKQCYKLLTDLLEEHLTIRVSELEVQMSKTHRHKQLRTKLVRSIWGSCTRTGNLTFNKRLIHYPIPIIDYVIVHELAHLQQHNHSKAFWDIVETHFPDYKNARNILKKNSFG